MARRDKRSARHLSRPPGRRGAVVAITVVLLLSVVLGVGWAFTNSRASRQPAPEPLADEPASSAESTQDADASTTAEAVPEGETQAVDITLVAVGDVLQHQGVWESGLRQDGTYDFHHIFAHLGDALDGADLKVLNQESILGGDIAPYSSYPSFNGPQEMGDAEADAGFNVILRASNHTMDMGYDGLRSELAFWGSAHPDVMVLGAVEAGASVDDVVVYERDGFRVALLNYTYGLNGYADPEGAVSMLDEEHVRTTLAQADAMADMVVVFPHWGEEYQTVPVESQVAWEEFLRDNGADVIVGAHPHVLEPVDTYERSDGGTGVCFWSLGNFVSGQVKNETLVGGLARVTLRKEADGTCSVVSATLEPVVTHKGRGSDMTVYRLRDYTDELAATNAFASVSNASLTPAWAQDFCADVLGKTYDREACVATVPLD